ncbi:MAG: tryptophan-rich sensory protein [Methanoregula sp.]|nr:tryptophan-rich sensory protein [Methanoregula sp.]
MRISPARSSVLFVLCLATPLIIGLVGSIFTLPEIAGWYAGLQKPVFNPPAWIFGPVWTLLYILMGYSLWLVIRDGFDGRPVQQAVFLFAVQLVANLAWSILFFGMHLIFVAFLEIIILFALVAATTFMFLRINTTAGWLFAPYLCWTAFATILTGTVWLLN